MASADADVRMLLVVDGDGVVRAANRFEWVACLLASARRAARGIELCPHV